MGPRELLLVGARALERAGAKYFVSGSMGAMIYGEFRFTNDVDIVADVRYGHMNALLETFKEPEYYLSKEAIVHAMEYESQFNAIHTDSALKIDFMIPEDSLYNRERFARARAVEIMPGEKVMASAPEDVILMKLKYFQMGGSDKHLRDIASMVKISGDTFDRAYLDQWAQTLGVAEEWAVTKRRVGW